MDSTRRKIISGFKAQNLPRLTDASDVAVAEVSRAGVVLDINELGRKLLGWKKNDRLAAPITSAIKTLPDGPPMRLPIGRHGIYVVGVSRGRDAGCLLFGFDIQNQRKSGPFEKLIERLPVAITRTDLQGIVSFANRHARKFAGKDPVGSSLWKDIVLDRDHWKLDAAFAQLAKDGHATTSITYVDPQGGHRMATLYLYPADQDAHFIDIASVDEGIATDEMDSFANDARYRTFVEQSPVAMVHLDSDGMIVMENHPFRQLIGEDPESAWIGHHYSDVTELSTEILETVKKMLDEGIPFLVQDIRFESPTGEYILTLRGAPIIQEDGKISGGVVIVEDRTSHKRAEEIIEKDRNEAIDSAALKSAFISTMSHELRTPLGAIHGYSDLLFDEVKEIQESHEAIPPVLLEFASIIKDRSASVLSIVDNLFDMALMDSGLVGLDSAPVDLRAVVERTVEKKQKRFEDKGIQLTTDFANDDDSVIEADERRIEQVLEILLDNALKFTPEGSVEITVSRIGDTKQIEVLDTGIGLDEEYMDKLFKPMTQADNRLNRQYDGAGIGLAMVDRVVQRMNGRVVGRNRDTAGSSFVVEFPVAEGSPRIV